MFLSLRAADFHTRASREFEGKKTKSVLYAPFFLRAHGLRLALRDPSFTMRTLLPCAPRKFAAQSGRIQHRPRPTLRRRWTAEALPPTETPAAKPSSPPTSTSSSSPTPPPPSPPAAAAAAAAPQPAPAAIIGAPELSLLFTAGLWGSYAPALRFLFSLEQPPSPATLTAARAVIQAALLLAFAAA